MMKPNFGAPSALLLPFSLLLASCIAQQGSNASEAQATEENVTRSFPPATDTTGQLAEYVVDAFADSKGVLWFGTMGKGVARFDGTALTFLSPADGKGGNVVSSIAEDVDGNLWFAGHEGTGLVKYDGEQFIQMWEDEGTVSTDRQGNIWASTSSAVYTQFEGDLVQFNVPIDRAAITVYSITPGRASLALEDSKGNFWFRTDGHGAIRYDGKTFTQFSKKDGLCSNTVNDIAEDAQGRIWFICMQAYQPAMTNDGGLCVLGDGRFTTFPDVEGLHNNDLYTLFKDRKGQLWIGATGVGLYRYVPSADLRASSNAFTLFNATDRPDLNSSFGLQGVAEDRSGIFWCGFSGGLFRFDPTEPQNEGGQQFVNVTRDGPWK